MHLDEERLQHLLHGELARADEAAARGHLAACHECSGRLASMAREEEGVGALLRELDRPAPRLDIGAIARRAESRGPWIPRWAAGVALVLGLAGGAYALPGSPLPRWVDTVLEWARGHRDPLSPSATNPTPPVGSPSGIAVSPGSSLLVLFTPPNARGQVVVTLTAGTEVEIRAPHGVATFTTGEDRLVVEDQGLEATYEIYVPLTAPRVEIRAGDRLLLRKEGPRVTTTGLQQGSGSYLLPLNAPVP